MDANQVAYLWKAGAKMAAFAAIMLIAACVVGFAASKVGAAVGRDLREKTFSKVVGFSNAEINKFSTASLITRSTNDIQQIQMVTTMSFVWCFTRQSLVSVVSSRWHRPNPAWSG